MESVTKEKSEGKGRQGLVVGQAKESGGGADFFQVPVHHPRYRRADYETTPEWKLDHLLAQYGLPVFGDLEEKRNFAMGAFLWPDDTHNVLLDSVHP
ncbi:hypothetical protein COCNU_08G010840 [Cocos nucifera]|uniref:DUF7722 domain-containing protein n=1 Tax=Cocos nucifera TaxID=13894 RepID=A0A8K0N647_COCNU|nr:hypothetical protein COCNU_08G010840 [Cocos nucifera]